MSMGSQCCYHIELSVLMGLLRWFGLGNQMISQNIHLLSEKPQFIVTESHNVFVIIKATPLEFVLAKDHTFYVTCDQYKLGDRVSGLAGTVLARVIIYAADIWLINR